MQLAYAFLVFNKYSNMSLNSNITSLLYFVQILSTLPGSGETVIITQYFLIIFFWYTLIDLYCNIKLPAENRGFKGVVNTLFLSSVQYI